MEGYTPRKNINIFTEFFNSSLGSFETLLDSYDSISLAEMDKVQLMNRVDTKFLLNLNQLPHILDKAWNHYRIVEIDGCRILPYSSIYLDTENAEMYHMHHNRKLNRYKIRLRSYVNSGISFLEIKQKSNKGRTVKKRIEIEKAKFETISLDEKAQAFLQEKSPYAYSFLKPQLQNSFQRMTFVDKKETERVTIDVGLTFNEIDSAKPLTIKNLVIVEMKQSGKSNSYFKKYMEDLSACSAMSKYCLGMALIYPNLKSNRFKQKLRQINKINEKEL